MDRARLWRAAPYAWGLVGVVVLVWSLLSSMRGFAGYSLRIHFISQLADPFNPHASRVNTGFMVGGAVIAIAMAMAATQLVRPHARRAAAFAAGTGASTAAVGLFPISAPAPHFAFAILAGVSAFTACVYLFRETTGRWSGGPAGVIAVFLVFAICASITLAIHLANIVVAQEPGSLTDLLRIPPAHIYWTVGATRINPFSVFEWIFFATVVLLFTGACAHCIREAVKSESADLAQIEP